jgi:predicted esterase
MKKIIAVIIISLLFVIGFPELSFAQTTPILKVENEDLIKELEALRKNDKITADSAWKILSDWINFPEIKRTGCNYLFLYKDSFFGTIPIKVFIPKNYRSDVPSPAILILHGAVVLSSFKDAYRDTLSDDDLFYSYFEQKNFIVIRPFADTRGPNADGSKLFGWVVNHFNGRANSHNTNPTYSTLCSIITQLKKSLNINDNKIFAFGHSDGSDGVFALQLYKPSVFAGFIGYNSMLTNIFAYDMYLQNTTNRQLYLVHSDLDDLRPIQQTRDIVRLFDSLKSPVLYKEYLRYKHFDDHLRIDLPYSYYWTTQISRNPFQQNIYWEMSDSSYNVCDWLKISKIDTLAASAEWYKEINTPLYNKLNKTYRSEPYYSFNKSAAVKAFYNNNKFQIITSRIKEIEVLISPVMVNLQNPVVIEVNGKEVFNTRLAPDKTFLLNNFSKTFDRRALWLTSVRLVVK